MAEQYGKLQCRIRVCEKGDRSKIRSELKKAEEEFEENTLLLEEKAQSCRSEAVKRLSQIQLDYRKKARELTEDQLVHDIHCEDSSPEGRRKTERYRMLKHKKTALERMRKEEGGRNMHEVKQAAVRIP